jgi:hypothetical protein
MDEVGGDITPPRWEGKEGRSLEAIRSTVWNTTSCSTDGRQEAHEQGAFGPRRRRDSPLFFVPNGGACPTVSERTDDGLQLEVVGEPSNERSA